MIAFNVQGRLAAWNMQRKQSSSVLSSYDQRHSPVKKNKLSGRFLMITRFGTVSLECCVFLQIMKEGTQVISVHSIRFLS